MFKSLKSLFSCSCSRGEKAKVQSSLLVNVNKGALCQVLHPGDPGQRLAQEGDGPYKVHIKVHRLDEIEGVDLYVEVRVKGPRRRL